MKTGELSGLAELKITCINHGLVDTLVLLKNRKDLAIEILPDELATLVMLCLQGGYIGKAEQALKNFPHDPETAERVIVHLLGIASCHEGAEKKMYWERAYDVACAEDPKIMLEAILEFALVQCYCERIDKICEHLGRGLVPFERSMLFDSLLSQNKLSEVFAMAEVLSASDKEKLIAHCADKGLLESWLKALEIAGRTPEDKDCRALSKGIENKACRIEEIVKRSAS